MGRLLRSASLPGYFTPFSISAAPVLIAVYPRSRWNSTPTSYRSFSTAPRTMSNNNSNKDGKSSPRQNRTDLLKPDFTPHKPVQPLGCDPLHGPSLPDHVVIILGVGPGLGISIAQVFASRGYITAILSRSKDRLSAWAEDLHSTALAFRQQQGLPLPAEGEKLSAAFACDALNNDSIASAIKEVAEHWKGKKIGTACYNASIRKRGPFLEQRLDQIKEGVQGSILGGFSFAQAVLREMEQGGEGGSLLVTGATSSTRGREGFAGFAASSKYSTHLTTTLRYRGRAMLTFFCMRN